MLCRSWALAVFAIFVGCVDVPDGVRAQFAGPNANDRTNYRPGNHGAEPAPVAKAATTTTTSAEADAAAPIEADGGAP